MTLKCRNGCCLLNTSKYEPLETQIDKHGIKKAGVLLYDTDTDSILIIQSKGNLWGIPKGTLKKGESYINCAFREVFEETGLNVSSVPLERSLKIGKTSIYYLMYLNKCNVRIQTHNKDNDANSIGWVKLLCLKEFIKDDIIKLTSHSEIILKTFLDFKL